MLSAQFFALDALVCGVWLRLARELPHVLLALTANPYAFLGMEVFATLGAQFGVRASQVLWHQRVLEDEAYIQRLGTQFTCFTGTKGQILTLRTRI